MRKNHPQAIAEFMRVLEKFHVEEHTKDPVIIQVSPHIQSQYLMCALNVATVIQKHGGSEQCCWDVARNASDGIVEFNAHFVWRMPSGDLLDVSPNNADCGTSCILPVDTIWKDNYPPSRCYPLYDVPELVEEAKLRELSYNLQAEVISFLGLTMSKRNEVSMNEVAFALNSLKPKYQSEEVARRTEALLLKKTVMM